MFFVIGHRHRPATGHRRVPMSADDLRLLGTGLDGAHDPVLIPLRHATGHVHHHHSGLRHGRLDLFQGRLDRLHTTRPSTLTQTLDHKSHLLLT